MALVFRLQLSQANAGVLGAERYNELISIHDTLIVFFVIVPLFAGLGNYLVPLMIGTTNVAFPRLNALSYWLFVLRRRDPHAQLLRQRRSDAQRLDRWTSRSRRRPPGTGRTSGSSPSTSSPRPRSQARSTSS